MGKVLAYMIVSITVGVVFPSALVIAQVTKGAPAARPIPASKDSLNIDRQGAPGAGDAVKGQARQAVAGKGVVAGRAANIDNLVQQFMHQGRPAVRAELIFVREICGLDASAFRRLNQDAETTLKSVAVTVAESQQPGRLPAQKTKGTTRSARRPNGLSYLREQLESAIKMNLTTGQFAEYQAEVEKRNADRKQAAVHYLVHAIDEDLLLSEEQRIKVTESLLSHWDDSWNTTLEYLLYGNQFRLLGVDPLITPYLNAAQVKVWEGTQKVGGIGGPFGVWGGFANDSDALEAELGLPRKAEPANKVRALRNEIMKVQVRPVDVDKKAQIGDVIPNR